MSLKHIFKTAVVLLCIMRFGSGLVMAQSQPSPREKVLMDFDWRFAFGHPFDVAKDFNFGTGYFSYLAKAGYGDGAASTRFDDRAWRKLDLPHDWAVEAPFSNNGSHSHGYKAVGRNFPDASVGWYRKSFTIPESDLGRKIVIEFDGVSRNSMVFINGFYLGTEASGYSSFEYDITDMLNYGGENVIAVRADVTLEEGWFYEGAGIYRHVWLTKTRPVHVASNGTFVTTSITMANADVTVNTTVVNEGREEATLTVSQTITDASGKSIAHDEGTPLHLKPLESKAITQVLYVLNPALWSVDSPYVHKLTTTLKKADEVLDVYKTNFGIRTLRMDADHGFFLNGKPLKLKGTNNHQDHAGVGTAIPDVLQDFRIKALKSMGSNAYRCSHNPPTPELLDACDRLGMLVIDENRLLGTTTEMKEQVKKMIVRDRNHPSVIAWSIGNEEWAIEGNSKGARMAETLQEYTKTIDNTRPITAAVSGGREGGISTVIEIMGYNYIGLGLTEEHHVKYPHQPAMGTEEGSTQATRGIYVTDEKSQYIAAYDKKPNGNFVSLEDGWTYYAEREFLAGMFIWTGFDYRGESTPYSWPSVYSYFGMFDACGFPKDNVYYLRSWWTDKPVLHILPHWNWKGKEGQVIDVWVYSNCDAVELFLNKKSQGKKIMKKNAHLEWKVNYNAGTLEAVGYKNGKKILTDVVKTTGDATAIKLTADHNTLYADRKDVAMITVQVNDNNALPVPDAGHEIMFSLQGPGKIIGVGNGDETSHEPDRILETMIIRPIINIKEKEVDGLTKRPEVVADLDDVTWPLAFQKESIRETATAMVYRGTFELPENFKEAGITFYYNSIGKNQSIYVNGVEQGIALSDEQAEFKLTSSILHAGKNTIAVVASPLKKKNAWDNLNTNPGILQLVFPPVPWKRKLFSGLAQVIVQTTGEPGEIILRATGVGVKESSIKIQSVPIQHSK